MTSLSYLQNPIHQIVFQLNIKLGKSSFSLDPDLHLVAKDCKLMPDIFLWTKFNKIETKQTKKTFAIFKFFAPTGAQEVTLSVCPTICLSIMFLNSSLNLRAFLEQS